MTRRHIAALFAAILTVSGWGHASGAADGDFTLHVFGDSLSDNGNLFALTAGTIPPSPFYYDGRFSNGPVWVEYLAGFLPGATLEDHAVGGAFSDVRNSNDDLTGLTLPGVLTEVAAFEGSGSRFAEDDLIVVWSGSNNYLFEPTVSVPQFVVMDVTEAIARLAVLGGRRFLVPNIVNIGRTPAAQTLPFLTPVMTAKIALHNALLAEALAQLGQSLDVEIIQLDAASFFEQALGGDFDFANTTDACLDLSTASVCENPNEYLFWDDVHPTTTVHKFLAILAMGAVGAAESSEIAAAE